MNILYILRQNNIVIEYRDTEKNIPTYRDTVFGHDMQPYSKVGSNVLGKKFRFIKFIFLSIVSKPETLLRLQDSESK